MSLRDLSLLKRGFILLKKYIVYKGYDFEMGAIEHTYSFFLFSSSSKEQNGQSHGNTKNRDSLTGAGRMHSNRQREIRRSTETA